MEMLDEDWKFRAPLQRAAVLCLHRGENTYEQIGERLGVSEQQVKDALREVSGVLFASYRNRLVIR